MISDNILLFSFVLFYIKLYKSNKNDDVSTTNNMYEYKSLRYKNAPFY